LVFTPFKLGDTKEEIKTQMEQKLLNYSALKNGTFRL
jgi:hypothetical protein